MAEFFDTPEQLRAWFAANHKSADELILGLWKVHTGRASLTWSQAVDEALCVGWIDGVGRRIDDDARSVRFTPRRSGSIWSAINIEKVARLSAEGRMLPAGLAAFERRREDRSRVYSHERSEDPELSDDEQAALRADARGRAYFESRAPSYRRAALHWVVSAKRGDTRARRLATLAADNAAQRPLKHLSR
jgi:uncharacterized protein YdeI (YjbR/CyaY-like superfamily)